MSFLGKLVGEDLSEEIKNNNPRKEQTEINSKRKNINKKIIIFIVLFTIVIGGASFYLFSHQKRVDACKKECYYRSESNSLLHPKGWNYNYRVFETQNQCIDYCLINK